VKNPPVMLGWNFGIHPFVAVIRSIWFTRFIFIPTGAMFIVCPRPVNEAELSHFFAASAARRAGALLG
jgi:hypothetical protein